MTDTDSISETPEPRSSKPWRTPFIVLLASMLVFVGAGVVATRTAVVPDQVKARFGHHEDRSDAVESPDEDEYGSDDEEAGYEDEAVDEGAAPLAMFPVKGDRLVTTNADPDLARRAKVIWSRFTGLIPAERRKMVSGFELQSRDFDGAYVRISDSDSTKWILGVQDASDDLDYMLVHEFGHLLTLNAGQIQMNASARTCTTYMFDAEGCARPDSIAARFLARFWSTEMRRDAEKGRGEELADRHRGSFVTEYAATDPAEDLAETFATFVFTARPKTHRVADAKVNFFWSIPELVQLRTQILAGASRR